MNISIIVAVLNEELLVRQFLQHLRDRAPEAEIVVVDGMSSDKTSELAQGFCDRLIRSNPGRAVQLNAGARIARGAALWFLHVDVKIPANGPAAIKCALQEPSVVGGFFRIRIPHDGFIYRLTDSLAHYLGLVLRIRCSDHGFFCRREIFEKIGGFPDVAFMEDADFYHKLRRAGETVIIVGPIEVSPRRYELIGPLRITFAYGLIGLLYFLHIPRNVLQAIYRSTCCRS